VISRDIDGWMVTQKLSQFDLNFQSRSTAIKDGVSFLIKAGLRH
jgi:hypothetical protein